MSLEPASVRQGDRRLHRGYPALPRDARLLEAGAGWLVSQEEYDKAIADFTEASGSIRKVASAYGSRGLAWSGMGDYDKAIADYTERDPRIEPNDAHVYTNRGLRGPSRMMTTRRSPTSPTRSGSIPNTLWLTPAGVPRGRERKSMIGTIADCTEAIRINPSDANAFTNRGLVWVAQMEVDKALADFNEAIRLDPQNSIASQARDSLLDQ